MGSKIIIPDDREKQLIQAKHRLEETENRDRKKEQKARTRRLIQEGAILEKAHPAVKEMELNDLQVFLERTFSGCEGSS